MMLTTSSGFADLMFSAREMTYSFISMIFSMSLPAERILAAYPLTISVQISSILKLDFLVISSMKSLMERRADSERMFWMCFDFTYWRFFSFCIKVRYSAGATNTLSLSSLAGDLNRNTLPEPIKNLMKFLSFSSKRQFLSPFISTIFSSSRIQLWYDCSLSALLMIKKTPSLMSSNVLKAFWRDLISLGNLSALVSEMWVSSTIRTSFTFLQISSNLWMKKEFEISYSSPLLSLNPGQSQKAMFSRTILVGTEVSENFWWPILMNPPSLLSRLGFNPSSFTVSQAPERKDMIVLFPTPVSPMTRIADSEVVSAGIDSIPFLIIYLSLGKSIGLSSI